MTLARRDDTVTDAQGRALAGAQVYYCLQPATTSAVPPSPLAIVYSDLAGTLSTNPQVTDGFGHAVAYLDDTVLYTVVYVHPLFGPNPVIYTDQTIGGGSGGGGGSTYIPFAQVPSGTINGVNTVFTLAFTPVQGDVWLNFALIPNLGYTLVGNTITYATAPQIGDNVYFSGWHL